MGCRAGREVRLWQVNSFCGALGRFSGPFFIVNNKHGVEFG
jgi:hypothetical protein